MLSIECVPNVRLLHVGRRRLTIGVSSRYVHPSEDAVLDAMSRLGGHKLEHSDDHAASSEIAPRQLTQ
jgi:hypothetical protein